MWWLVNEPHRSQPCLSQMQLCDVVETFSNIYFYSGVVKVPPVLARLMSWYAAALFINPWLQ